MYDFLVQGGNFMWVLLGWSILGLGFILERAYALFIRFRIDGEAFMRKVLGQVATDNYAAAVEVCNGASHHPLGQVVKAGLLKANKSDREIQRSMEEEMLKRLPAVQRNIDYIAMAANIATLLGLLGTIFGLIMAFKGVAGASAQMRQEHLARGISVAMYTTAFGLMIAITFLFAHYWLNRRGARIIEVVEEAAVSLLNGIAAQRTRASRG